MNESTPLSEEQQQQKRKWWKKKDNREICQDYCQMYRKKFRDIDYISSTDLVQMQQNNRQSNIVLIDVRTEPERQVSMLQGAITKEQFEDLPPPTKEEAPLVITYCTVGYRSGLEARRLGLQHPEWRSQIKSLDGFVSYTHALGETMCDDNGKTAGDQVQAKPSKASEQSSTCQFLKLVKPTGEATTQVHTFGRMWECVDDQHFQATSFSIPELLVRVLQVMIAVITCFFLRNKSYCLPAKPRRVLLDEVLTEE